ncbi:MbtH family protein [Streptomyces sp. NPDC001709]
MTQDSLTAWTVLINSEEQYGLFPNGQTPPQGWQEAGFSGTEEECVRYVDEHWTDMRPLSLRRELDAEEAHA